MSLRADIKILVVDDMATMRKIIKNMLGQIGFTNIDQADDGATAWPKVQEAHAAGAPYEFIISDWNMPQLNGLDFLKKLRDSSEFKDLKFLMITAEAEQGNVVIAVKAGVSNFIVKPFSAQVLKEKIDKIFK